MSVSDDLCRCGHDRATHTHLRRGTDCSLCDGTCEHFRQPMRTRVQDAMTRLRRPAPLIGPAGTVVTHPATRRQQPLPGERGTPGERAKEA